SQCCYSSSLVQLPSCSTIFPYTTLFRSVIRSMSRKGNCWDNAVGESFFKSLKTELIYGNKLVTKEQMKIDVFEYIEIWYNKKRRSEEHTSELQSREKLVCRLLLEKKN